MFNDAPPAADEFELTVFGPGIGECVILHIGNGDWLIIDSCLVPGTDEPAALHYLRLLGVDPSTAVKLVVATHWHDDHIHGLAKVIDECSAARFVTSAAIESPQFLQLVLEIDDQTRLVKHTSSAREFAEVLRTIGARTKSSYIPAPIFAQDGMVVFRGGYLNQCAVWALSPSPHTITSSMGALANQLVTSGHTRRFRHLTPNDLSVAILVDTGIYNFLLGADLENSANPLFGWQAVLGSTLRPNSRAGAFKVAHHGSSNADHPGIWSTLLNSNPVAIVTPFARSASPIPKKTDLARIKSHANEAYCTSWPITLKPDLFTTIAARPR